MSDFKTYIENLLKTYVPSLTGDKFNRFVDKQALDIWKRAFTHQSYNADPAFNYEPLETEGDRVLDLVFTSFIMEYYKIIMEKDITPQFITNLKHYYMSKLRQGELGEMLGLPRFLIKSDLVTTDISMVEDMFESFFGALYNIGNNISYGFGMTVAYAFFRKLFEEVDIDHERRFGDAKTIVTQAFQSLGWGAPIVEEFMDVDDDGKPKATISVDFPQKVKDYIEEKLKGRYRFPSGAIAVRSSTSSRRAENEAFEYFLTFMNSIGINRDYIRKSRENKIFADFGESYTKALTKANKAGYKLIEFSKPYRTGPGKEKFYVQLKGVNDDDRSIMLEAVIANSYKDGQRLVLEKYIQ